MSTNGLNVCEDAEMADCDGEKVVTMMDVLKEQEDFEEDANAVLGASDDKNCTYQKGYVKRQAIYACMSCCTDAKDDPTKWAGVCLACSLNCHENHELIELYTKRNFRCDCGNPKFNSHPCQFTPNKTDLNVENSYNQNFSGIYCICHRPYPDPDSSTQGDMIQCIICEDWLHSNHLDAVVPPNDQYSEMICKACMDKNEFLHDYSNLAINKDNMDVDILDTSSEATSVTNYNKSSIVEVDESIANSNSSSSVNEQIKNDNAEKENDKDKNIEKNTTESIEEQVSMKEEQSIIDHSENEVTPNELAEKEEDVCKLESKQTNVQNSLTDEDGTSTINKNTGDSRSQEQVEEDLLLEDPMDTGLDQKEDVALHKVNSDKLGNEMKFESASIQTSESVSEGQEEKTDDDDLQNTSKSDSVPATEQSEIAANSEESETVTTVEESEVLSTVKESENMATDEKTELPPASQPEYIATTNELHNVISAEKAVNELAVAQTDGKSTTDIPENEQAGSAITTERSEGILNSEESMTAPSSEQSESISTTKESENTNEVPAEQLDQDNGNVQTERDDLGNENKIDIDESVEKEKPINIITSDPKNNIAEKDEGEMSSTCHNELVDKTSETDILKRKLSSDGDIENLERKKRKLDENKCVRPSGVKKMYHGATFWPSNFRQKLCTCNECISMYKDLSVLFLIDPEDTVTAYETLGKEKTDGKPASQYEKGMAALSSLGRVQQINALTEYTKLRDKLLDFLKTFKDKKVIVKEEDIKAFFAGMKPVREPDGVYFCR